MVLQEEHQKAEMIERVAQRAAAEGADVGRFVRQLYANVPPEALLPESEESLADAALAFWAFAAERRAGTPKIRVQTGGGASPYTAVEIVNDDMPFLVDSVTAELVGRGVEIFLVLHPVVRVERDTEGRLLSLTLPDEGSAGHDESFMQVRVGSLPPERWGEVCQGLERVLADVRAAVLDWTAMRDRCREVCTGLRTSPPPLPTGEVTEAIAFLDWLRDHSFTFLGYREYSFEGSGETAVGRIVAESGLGVLREERVVAFEELRNVAALPPEIRAFVERPELMLVTKTKMLSSVHRRIPMDAVVVKSFDAAGKVTGQLVLVGLFTSSAYLQSVHEIPFLRQKVRRAMERSGFSPASHNGKNLLSVLETFPRDELFQTGEDDLFRVAKGVLYLLQRPRIAVFVRADPFGRFVSCLILVPAERFEADLKDRFEEVLAAAYQGRPTLRHSQLRDGTLAWLLFNVETPGGAPAVDQEALETRLAEAARTWEDRLEEVLTAERGEAAGTAAARRFGHAFPAGYRELFSPQDAAFDVERLEEATSRDDLAFQLYRPATAAPNEIHFKIFGTGPRVALSDLLPMLENMGLRVLDENLYTVASATGPAAWIRDFNMAVAEGAGDPLELAEQFEGAFAEVWRGAMENDGFNRLVLRAALSSREVTVLRAYCKFLRQAIAPFSQTYMEEALDRHGDVARLLYELFSARCDPDHRDGADLRAARCLAEIEEHLTGVGNLDDLRILRRFVNLIESTLRTNAYQLDAAGRPKSYLSFKLDSQRIDGLPLPRPLVEIFVCSPAVEAVHLRGGRVARGGIRWSDRREDFRTEVLGLMKAQMVKNAVIVPVGSKGGFVIKRQVPREALHAEAVECYQTMMHGLLDVTDNLVAGALVPPERVVRRDGDDPYLVVAADKGTARFSDLANSISVAHGFWLDDAFASGGSAGYDHKAMAITSRGLWESVKRHFRELDKDVQNEDFTVAGVGDMSGDVFGNGMLRSRHIRLVGAFDHRHVFVDPDPDAAASFAERQRLFDLPASASSSWADYDRSLISPGGGVWERGVRSIPVSPEMAARFGLTVGEIAPAELMQAILKAPVELLFFGGIGTFVKSRNESHADAKDRANDPVRVDGGSLRARVIGEGANLAVTQRGRIEYALAGGHLNTDFIDNSAGVDCSDHEVNIKILLNEVERSGGLTREARNALLKAMTDEVAELVLRDNYLQTQALSVTKSVGGHHLLDRLARVMRGLERDGRLDRRLEALPDDDELKQRAQERTGFTRPELSVLLSYAKIALYDEILRSDLPDDPFMQEDLQLYFPAPLRERFAEEIGRHRLCREIISTAVTNSMVNRAGIAFVREVKEKTGEEAADIARAYVVSRDVFGLRRIWHDVEALDNKVPAAVQASMLAECGRLIDRATTWFLRFGSRPLDIGFHSRAYAEPIAEIAAHLDEILSAGEVKQLADKAGRFTAHGVPASLARTVAALAPWLAPALDAVRIARDQGLSPLKVARLYFLAGERFGFVRLREAAAKLPTDKAWDKLAVTAVTDDLYSYQRAATARVLASAGAGVPPEAAVEAWAETRRPVLGRAEELLAELKTTETPELAMLTVATQQLKALGA